MSGTLTFLGPSGTFTHQAALALRPHAETLPVTSAAAALDAVVAGTADVAVVPIDNTVNGVVVPTLDALLQRPGLAIVDSVVVPISFDAYVADREVAPTVVVSHPHGLAQCRDFIAELGLPTREAASTAAACRDVRPGEVALGPAVCGSLYPIERLRAAVEDHGRAFTQFALVGPAETAVAATGGEGLLVALFPPRNVPGILRRLLEVLEGRGINMTNLVTRPVPATPGEFVFLLFLAGDHDVAALRTDWQALDCEARLLGRISPLAELVRRHEA